MIKQGTWVKITKVAIFAESKIQPGTTYVGQMEYDLKESNIIRLNLGEHMHTSNVNKILKTGGGDFIVRTSTSLYFIQELK